MPKGLNDSILIGKESLVGQNNKAAPSQLAVRAPGQGSSALDYDDPLYTESACQNYTNKVTASPLEMAEPAQNSKPLLVSELVNNYKGIGTSTLNEPAKENQIQSASSKVIADFANDSMNPAKEKNYTIIGESADEHDFEQEHQLNALQLQL